MDAHKALISIFLTMQLKSKVPFFQRAYVWDEDCERFLEDMEFLVESKRPHFFWINYFKRSKSNRN